MSIISLLFNLNTEAIVVLCMNNKFTVVVCVYREGGRELLNFFRQYNRYSNRAHLFHIKKEPQKFAEVSALTFFPPYIWQTIILQDLEGLYFINNTVIFCHPRGYKEIII